MGVFTVIHVYFTKQREFSFWSISFDSVMNCYYVITPVHFKRFSRVNVLFCLVIVSAILHPSVYILTASKKSYASCHQYCIEYRF